LQWLSNYWQRGSFLSLVLTQRAFRVWVVKKTDQVKANHMKEKKKKKKKESAQAGRLPDGARLSKHTCSYQSI